MALTEGSIVQYESTVLVLALEDPYGSTAYSAGSMSAGIARQKNHFDQKTHHNNNPLKLDVRTGLFNNQTRDACELNNVV